MSTCKDCGAPTVEVLFEVRRTGLLKGQLDAIKRIGAPEDATFFIAWLKPYAALCMSHGMTMWKWVPGRLVTDGEWIRMHPETGEELPDCT